MRLLDWVRLLWSSEPDPALVESTRAKVEECLAYRDAVTELAVLIRREGREVDERMVGERRA